MFLLTKSVLFKLLIINCFFDSIFDPCQSSPCQNYGTCFYHFSSPYHFYCECKDEFEGDYCENEIKDPCESNPCYNNAECVSRGSFKNGDYDCKCKENTHGSYCEITDPCQRSPCHNDGTCIFEINTASHYSCSCKSNFTGVNCEKEIKDPCKSNPCYNNAECVSRGSFKNGLYTCYCKENTYGSNCEKTDPCQSSPCQNDGTCIFDKYTTSNYSCVCKGGFKGVNCEFKRNDLCIFSPCKNIGKCIITDNISTKFYRCECENGYYGRNCEFNILKQNCSISSLFKCKNNGVCEHDNKANIYSCKCPVFYKGLQCEHFNYNYNWIYYTIAIIAMIIISVIIYDSRSKIKCFKKENNISNANATFLNYLERSENIDSDSNDLQNSSFIEPIAEVDFNLPSYNQAMNMNHLNV